MKIVTRILFVLIGMLGSSAHAQESRPATRPADDPMTTTAALVASSVCPEPTDALKAKLTPEFLKQAPWLSVKGILVSMARRCGSATGWEWMDEGPGARSGAFRILMEKGFEVRCDLTLGPTGNEVTGLLLQEPLRQAETLDDILTDIQKLPGDKALWVGRLDKTPTALAELNPTMTLPTGSTFKLWILGALAEEVAAGRARFSDVIPLRKEWMSLPSGRLHTWPVGTPMTLQALASAMISESDNTATDHLLFHLGRPKVEAFMASTGHRNPARNVPMLATRELFALKFSGDPQLADRYVGADADGRLAILKGITSLPMKDLAIGSSPLHTEDLEWFASPRDLVDAMVTLRRLAERPECQPILGCLGINSGFVRDAGRFPVMAFKGGSEPGVLNLTWMWKDDHGRWGALSLSQRRSDGLCDEARGARYGIRLMEAARRAP